MRVQRILCVALSAALLAGPSWAQGPVLFEDTFSDGDASDWQVFAPGWSEGGGLRLARNTGASQEVASVWPLGYEWSDYAVEADIWILDERNVSQADLVFRFNRPFPDLDYCRCGFFHGIPNLPGLPSAKYLRLICPGVDNVEPFAFVAGTLYRLRATAIGKTATCEILGHPEVPRLVTSHPGISCTGTAGLRSTHIRSDFDNFLVTSIPSAPDPACLGVPIADAGPDQVLDADASCQALAQLDGSASIAPLGDELLFEWSSSLGPASGSQVSYLLPVGVHSFLLTVTDSDGDSDSDETIVTVVDSQPPTLAHVEASPDMLWPPNHTMRTVQLNPIVSDNCDTAVLCEIVSVSSNETAEAAGVGITVPEWEVTEPLALSLRAERVGSGDGRTYSIEVACSDSSGNVSVATASVRVPHDRR